MEIIHFCVYIMTDKDHSLLYTGRTSNLKRRMAQHRSGNGGVFTRRYNLTRLVYYELVETDSAARQREKEDQTHFQTTKSEINRRYEPGVEGFIFGNLRIKD